MHNTDFFFFLRIAILYLTIQHISQSLYHAIMHLCLAFLSLYLTILQLKSEKNVELQFGEQLCNNQKIIINLWQILLYPLFTLGFKLFRLAQLQALI